MSKFLCITQRRIKIGKIDTGPNEERKLKKKKTRPRIDCKPDAKVQEIDK